MLARSVAIAGAAAAAVAMLGAEAQAFGKQHGCCRTGPCYKKVMSPPVYRTVTARVMVSPARCVQSMAPPVYGYRPVPVLLEPERRVVRYAPAVHRYVTRTHVLRQARTGWKVTHGCCGEEIRCAVKLPAELGTYTEKVEVRPSSSWVETRPAVRGVINRRVKVRPGSFHRYCQPAVYKTVHRRVMVSPGAAQWVPVSGRYGCKTGRW